MRGATACAEPGANSHSRTCVSDDAIIKDMSNHAMVNSGSAHHTRCVVREETGGGGGGRGTLESAVMLSSLVVASMTVTEVTTRIAIVGVVTLTALFLIGGSGIAISRNGRTGQPSNGRFTYHAATSPRDAAARWITARRLVARPSTKAAHIASLGIIAILGGAALGIGTSLLLVVALNATGSGAG